jgi:internalin A
MLKGRDEMTDADLLALIDRAEREGWTELDLGAKQIKRLPPKIGQLRNLTKLYLYGNQLTAVPPEIGQLTNLTTLELWANKLTAVPLEIGQLLNLTELVLSGNQLTAVPPEIGQLVNLTKLELWGNQLTTMPLEIGQLLNLTELVLSGNQLTDLPPEIGQLLSLTVLSLRDNRLMAVPHEIGQLVNLTQLDLSDNPLSFISLELGKLVNLQGFYFDYEHITIMPSEVGRLHCITKLDLSRKKLTAMPPGIGQLLNLTWLHLGGNQLTTLPPEIGQLLNLTELSLRNNQLTALPPEIGQLLNLKELYLSHNQLTALPPEIGQLLNLTQLDLRDNPLSFISLELGKLVNLQDFYFDYEHIAIMPSEVGRLRCITKLDLSGKKLTAVPPEIGRLTNLTELDLRGNKLTTLPPEIGLLTNLTELILSGNQLTAVPPEIGQLSNLTALDLSRNQLTAVPPEIGQLVNLTELTLHKNQLTAVPPEIGQLVNLTGLYLSGNQLTAVPPEIGQLSKLTELDLGNNQLEFLPTFLTHLPHLKELHLYGNPLLKIPTELTGQDWGSHKTDPQPILEAYFQQCAPLHQLKLLLLGEGEVGKTSLVERLLHNHPPSNSGKTIGLDIHPWQIELETAPTTTSTPQKAQIAVNVWDFGGQEIYHATHQFFLSHRSLYLLLLDARQDDEANRLAYWLQLIQSFGGNSPIILVVNKIDYGIRRVAERELQAQYPQLQHIIYTSCLTGEGITTLRNALTATISTMPHIHDQIPQTWLAVKNRLATMSQDFISYDRFTKLCRKEGIQQPATQEIVARLLHDLGAALNYADESSLAGTYILQPDWVTYGIYQIVNAPHLQAHGLLHPHDLRQIFHNQPRYPFHKHHILLDMMVKFELCPKETLPDGRHLIPTLLHPDRPLFDWPTNDPPRFQLRYKVLPPSVLARLMVRLHRHLWQEARWRDGFVLARNGARAMVRALREQNQIHIWLDGDADARRTLLTLIRTQLEEIHASFARLEVEEWVPLPNYAGQAIKYDALLRMVERSIPRYWDANTDVEFEVLPLLDSLETPVDRLERRLHRTMNQRFNMGELRTLVEFDLGWDYEQFPQTNKSEFVRELIMQCQRQGVLGRLEQLAQKQGGR